MITVDVESTGKRIMEVANSKGYQSQKQFADAVGIAPQVINKWIKGRNMPRVDLLFACAKVCECNVEELVVYNEME